MSSFGNGWEEEWGFRRKVVDPDVLYGYDLVSDHRPYLTLLTETD